MASAGSDQVAEVPTQGRRLAIRSPSHDQGDGYRKKRFSLPVLPLRDTVVYPGVAVPISAGRTGTIEAVQQALEGDRRLFAVAQRDNQEEADPQILYAVGTVVRVIQTHRVRGGIQLLAAPWHT